MSNQTWRCERFLYEPFYSVPNDKKCTVLLSSLHNRSGSGEVSQALSSILRDSICLCTDVNQLAARKTHALLAKEKVSNFEVIGCDLFSAFRPGCLFDVIVFNPPYVPTDNEEMSRALRYRDISASWAGGKDGREVIDRFLSGFVTYLRKGGVAYLVVLEANDPVNVGSTAEENGCTVSTVIKRKAGTEDLYILRFQKN